MDVFQILGSNSGATEWNNDPPNEMIMKDLVSFATLHRKCSLLLPIRKYIKVTIRRYYDNNAIFAMFERSDLDKEGL